MKSPSARISLNTGKGKGQASMTEFLNTTKIGSGNKMIVYHFPAQMQFDAFYESVIASFGKRLKFDARVQAACRQCTLLFTRQPVFQGNASLRVEFINAEAGIYAYPHGYDHLIAKRIATDTGLVLFPLAEKPNDLKNQIQIGICTKTVMQEHLMIMIKQAVFFLPAMLTAQM